ncbi:Methyltransferase type 11 [Xanthobacter versatilis]|uniref:Methyltransferase type 11 n=1 Tax=Xanthobacter autotrophicus (strain ATCC BAA-1158 / Py2) TaxID=78245 RepID=A7ILF4_XANP2|nr:Methyltransferase type 11 [Xanthobacter autotrophicus Py2]
MNAHILTGGEVTTGRRKPSDLVAEYEMKVEAVPAALAEFEAAQNAVKMAASIGGTWGNRTLETGRLGERDMLAALLGSAWRHTYQLYALENFASAADKKRIEQMFADPPPFTVENIRERFGAYIMDPWGSILRGLAEQFAGLDPAFKSHEKMKIGVSGLPKRVILSGFSEYSSCYGAERVRDIVNALAAYQGKPLLTHRELAALIRDGNALIEDGVVPADKYNEAVKVIGRGVWLKRFQNGNGHLFFGPQALADVNRALSEFYGDVLPDTAEEKPAKPRASTAVAKDLQYYPTPEMVVERVLCDLYVKPGERVLEPSCGCGRFMDALRTRGARVFGIEVDPGRAAQCRSKGHSVLTANFLEAEPTGEFDRVVMNPPFWSKHYAKHVNHALRFLKPGGVLTAILPATARYDHGLLDGKWNDLPVGSFSESGTNICTTVLTIHKTNEYQGGR